MSDLADYTNPDFLDRLANQELANGREVNAAALRRAYGAWKRDLAALQAAELEHEPLYRQVRQLEERLANVQRVAAAEPKPTPPTTENAMDNLNIRISHRRGDSERVIEIDGFADTPPVQTINNVMSFAADPIARTTPIKIAADGSHLPPGYRGTDHLAVLDPTSGIMRACVRLGGKKGRPQREIIEEARALDHLGFRDWRLWTPHEAFPIVDHSKFKPAVDTNLYPCITPDFFWTDQDTHEGWSASAAFGVLFGGGDVHSLHRGGGGFGLAVRRVGQ